MAKVVRKRTSITKGNLDQHLREFLNTKTLQAQVSERLTQQRDRLAEYAEEHGEPDDKGHHWIEVPGVGTIKRERRVSSHLDEEFAEEWLKSQSLYDDCTTTIVVLDEDAILAKIYDKTIPKKVADKMYATKESFAFKVTEEK